MQTSYRHEYFQILKARELSSDSPGNQGDAFPPQKTNKIFLVAVVPISKNSGDKPITLWSHPSNERWTNGTSFVITVDTDGRGTAGF